MVATTKVFSNIPITEAEDRLVFCKLKSEKAAGRDVNKKNSAVLVPDEWTESISLSLYKER